jgi:hypothetical protein
MIAGSSKAGPSPKHYFFATQDQEMRNALEQIPGVPLLYLNKVTLVLSNTSKASLNYNNQVILLSIQFYFSFLRFPCLGRRTEDFSHFRGRKCSLQDGFSRFEAAAE